MTRLWASLVAQMVKKLTTIAGYLGWEDPLEEGMPTHSSILAWRIPQTRETWWATVHRASQSRTRLKRLSMHTCG